MNIQEFNKTFPNSTYRLVHENSKNPINDLVYGFDEAINYIQSSGKSYRLGWLVDSEHIVIDVDCDPLLDTKLDKARRVFNLLKATNTRFIMYTTPHGMHCIFRLGSYTVKNVVKALVAIGVKVDVRVKGGYVILPHNDSNRHWWKNSSVNGIDELPFFLKVVTKSKNVDELWGLTEGEGRNDAMYRLLQTMKTSQMVKLTADEIKECIIHCNNFVLATPIGERELYSTILRPENLVINKKQDTASMCAEYAIQINNENDILYVNNTFFHIVDDSNIYHQMSDEEMDRFVYLNYTKELSSKNREEVLKALRHEAFTEWSECNRDPYDIPFLNGIYNVKTGGFRPTLATDNITYCIPHNYNPNAPRTTGVDAFYSVSLENDHYKRVFFSTMLGYSMTRSADYQVFFVFKGRGGTGKSTMLDIIRNIIGESNISNLQLDDFTKEFGLEALFNKLVNLGDDISGTRLIDSQAFKKASSGDVINANRKHKSALAFAPFAKIIFTSNSYPKIVDKSRAMERRMRLVSSDRVIKPDEIIPNFVKNLTENDYAVIINDALIAFHEFLASGVKQFPDPEESKQMKEKLRLLSDHVYSFVKVSYPDRNPKEALHNRGVTSIYQDFVTFCRDRNYNIMSLDTFREQVCDVLEYDVTLNERMGNDTFIIKEEIN